MTDYREQATSLIRRPEERKKKIDQIAHALQAAHDAGRREGLEEAAMVLREKIIDKKITIGRATDADFAFEQERKVVAQLLAMEASIRELKGGA